MGIDTSAVAAILLGESEAERFAEVACEEFSLPDRHVPRTPPSFQVGS